VPSVAPECGVVVGGGAGDDPAVAFDGVALLARKAPSAARAASATPALAASSAVSNTTATRRSSVASSNARARPPATCPGNDQREGAAVSRRG
jgi:hypothetical protein